MCFSTEASFTAAAILSVVGGLTWKTVTSRSQFFLAAIPLLFALQQFSEGFVWLNLSQHIGSPTFLFNATVAFLTFAFLIWPIWIPLSLMAVEKVMQRRRILFLLVCCGIVLTVLNVIYALKEDVSVQIVNHSIQYTGSVPKQTFIYPFIILIPCFISSMRNVYIFGLLIAIGYVIADYYYTQTFISVWCFFSGIVSLFIYKILRNSSIHLVK